MNKNDLLESLTQCRVDLRAAMIELNQVKSEKHSQRKTENAPIPEKKKAFA